MEEVKLELSKYGVWVDEQQHHSWSDALWVRAASILPQCPTCGRLNPNYRTMLPLVRNEMDVEAVSR